MYVVHTSSRTKTQKPHIHISKKKEIKVFIHYIHKLQIFLLELNYHFYDKYLKAFYKFNSKMCQRYSKKSRIFKPLYYITIVTNTTKKVNNNRKKPNIVS